MWLAWQTGGLGAILIGRIRKWWTRPGAPDPWPADLDAAVRAPEAVPVCHRCATPCGSSAWFCPACGAAVGPYNNVMPYVYVFSIGEVLRSGVGPEAHLTPWRTAAYLFLGLAQYGLFAPLYFLRLCLAHCRRKKEPTEKPADPEPASALEN